MALQSATHQTEKKQLGANLERANSRDSTLERINDGFSRSLAEEAGRDEAFKEALDEASPGWRDANGSYKTVGARIVLPNSSASAPNPPQP